MITGRLRPVIKLVLGFGFDFGNENQITCTRSNQQAFGNELLAYENGLLLCLEKVLGTNRIKLGLGGKRWCELLSFAVMTGATRWASDNSPGRVSQVMTTRQSELQEFSERKILKFFGIRREDFTMNVSSPHDARRRRRCPRPLVLQKKSMRLLQFVPTEDRDRRLKQMTSLASALTYLNMEFSNHLTYFPRMAPRSANQSFLENGDMQTLTKEDRKTIECCTTMIGRGQFPPLMVVYDSCQGYTVEADGLIKDMTFIAEYTGDVDYLRKREYDDCDSMMTLLLAEDGAASLVICADKRTNIARFISGINNHTP
ncbi:putative Histone-lysine N-methyltransferase ATXR5 [Trifolium repens]|nr:putative Histone-lysine N-methyltransferase ATXR5 [Trifolium repens]